MPAEQAAPGQAACQAFYTAVDGKPVDWDCHVPDDHQRGWEASAAAVAAPLNAEIASLREQLEAARHAHDTWAAQLTSERDEAREKLAGTKANRDTLAEHARAVERECVTAERERDRYRKALEAIATGAIAPMPATIAREALEGGTHG